MLPFDPETRRKLLDDDDSVSEKDLDALEELIALRMRIDRDLYPADAHQVDLEIAARISKIKNYTKVVPGVNLSALVTQRKMR